MVGLVEGPGPQVHTLSIVWPGVGVAVIVEYVLRIEFRGLLALLAMPTGNGPDGPAESNDTDVMVAILVDRPADRRHQLHGVSIPEKTSLILVCGHNDNFRGPTVDRINGLVDLKVVGVETMRRREHMRRTDQISRRDTTYLT